MVSQYIEQSIQSVKQLQQERGIPYRTIAVAAGIGALALKRTGLIGKIGTWGKEGLTTAGRSLKRLGSSALRRNKTASGDVQRPEPSKMVSLLTGYGVDAEVAAQTIEKAAAGETLTVQLPAIEDASSLIEQYAKPIEGTYTGHLRNEDGAIKDHKIYDQFLKTGQLTEITYRQSTPDDMPLEINRIHDLLPAGDGTFHPIALVTDVDRYPQEQEPVVTRSLTVYGNFQLPQPAPSQQPAPSNS